MQVLEFSPTTVRNAVLDNKYVGYRTMVFLGPVARVSAAMDIQYDSRALRLSRQIISLCNSKPPVPQGHAHQVT